MTAVIEKAWAFLRAEWASQADAAHDFGHIRRVCAMARRIALTEGPVDAEALEIACILHDLVNVPKSHPDRAKASTLSGARAKSWLIQQGWAEMRAMIVEHAIASHSFSANIPPKSAEARILQDADRIEALGAIGLARMFAVAGSIGRSLFDHDDPLARNRPLDDQNFALDHLETKIFRLPAQMQTETGKHLAKQRQSVMHAFRNQLLSEIEAK